MINVQHKLCDDLYNLNCLCNDGHISVPMYLDGYYKLVAYSRMGISIITPILLKTWNDL